MSRWRPCFFGVSNVKEQYTYSAPCSIMPSLVKICVGTTHCVSYLEVRVSFDEMAELVAVSIVYLNQTSNAGHDGDEPNSPTEMCSIKDNTSAELPNSTYPIAPLGMVSNTAVEQGSEE